jgi:phage-related protein
VWLGRVILNKILYIIYIRKHAFLVHPFKKKSVRKMPEKHENCTSSAIEEIGGKI